MGNKIGVRRGPLGVFITFFLSLLVISSMGCGTLRNSKPAEPITSGAQGQVGEATLPQTETRYSTPVTIEPPLSRPTTTQPTSIAFVKADNIFIADEDGTHERQLTFDTRSYDAPQNYYTEVLFTSQWGGLCFSNSGDTIAAWKNPGDSYDLVLVDAHTGEQTSLDGLAASSWKELNMSPTHGNLCWSPQDKSLFCTTKEYDSDRTNVMKIDLSIGAIQLVISDASGASLTADGSMLSSARGDGSVDKVLATGEEEYIPNIDLGDFVNSPNVNAYADTSGKGWPDNMVYAINKDDGKMFNYTSGVSPRFTHPSFSPDGDRVVYCCTNMYFDEGGKQDISISESAIYVADLDYPREDYSFSEPVKWGDGLFPAWSPR